MSEEKKKNEFGEYLESKLHANLRITRYFEFSRVNPKEVDYALLHYVCRKIDAYYGIKLEKKGKRVHLHGFIMLRGRPTFQGDLCQLFPNFHLTYMKGEIGKGFETFGKHPYDDIKRVLF